MSGPVFPHQRSAYRHLLDTGNAYFSIKWHRLPIQPRFHRLIIGPTGVGKSHLVKAVAKGLEAGYFKVNLMSYLPCGCSQAQGRQTAKELLDVLLENERTVVFIDELDKIDQATSWTAYIKAEIYGLLDGLWPIGLDFAPDSPEEDGPHYRRARAKHRLRYKCYVVAAGTWQSVWNESANHIIGYNSSPATEPSFTKLVSSIPAELINRFTYPPILISPLTLADYGELIHASAASLPEDMADQFFAIGMSGIKSALEYGKGCRYVEEVLTQVLLTKTPSKEPSLH